VHELFSEIGGACGVVYLVRVEFGKELVEDGKERWKEWSIRVTERP
jgi:hypothetical protein